MSRAADPHRTLGLAPGASVDEVRHAYRRLAKLYHPDSAGATTTARFIAIQRAYEALMSGLGLAPGDPGHGAWGQHRQSAWQRPPSGPRSAPGSYAGAPPRAADPERARATREAGSGPRERWRRGDRVRPKARPGSTSYDGAETEAFEPEWDGATWYGAASGTYWTINPKEYADPRKHGPEYQARGRRAGSEDGDTARDEAPADPMFAAAGAPDATPRADASADARAATGPTTARPGRSPIPFTERVVPVLVAWLRRRRPGERAARGARGRPRAPRVG